MTQPSVVRFDGIDPADADRIVEVLRPFVSSERSARIESTLATRTRSVVMLLEDVASEHNAAAVMRTADALGILEAHIVPRTSTFTVSRKVSIGVHKWIDLSHHRTTEDAYARLRGRGYQIWASSVHGDAVSLEEIPTQEPVALVFGNEHEGVTRAAAEAAQGRFRIPMLGFSESFNISVAAAISAWDVMARRSAAGTIAPLEPDDARRLRAAWYALSVRAAKLLLARAELPAPSMTELRYGYRERPSEPIEVDPDDLIPDGAALAGPHQPRGR